MLSGLILAKLFGVVNVTIDTVISFCTAIYIGGFNFPPLKPGLLRRQSLLRVAIRSSPDTVIESEASCWMHATDHSSIKNRMTRTHIAWRYLLRNGRFITTSVQLPQEHVFAYVTRDRVTIFALLSLDAERLLLKLIQQSVSSTSRTSPATHLAVS